MVRNPNRPICKARTASGKECRVPVLQGGEYCFTHDPAMARERAEARRLGGLRRRREKTVSTVYDWEGLTTVEGLQRLLHIAVNDTLGLDNGVSRTRALGYLVQVALRAIEVGALEERVGALEDAMKNQADQGHSYDRGG